MTELGTALRDHRRPYGLTQRDLAELAGVSERTVRQIEQGRARQPRPASLNQLNAALRKMEQSSALTIDVLGPLMVRRGVKPVVITSVQQKSLLGLLALYANQVVPHVEIVEALWGHRPPSTYRELLHTLVSRLRKLLGGAAIVTHQSGYLLHIQPSHLDLLRRGEGRGRAERDAEAVQRC